MESKKSKKRVLLTCTSLALVLGIVGVALGNSVFATTTKEDLKVTDTSVALNDIQTTVESSGTLGLDSTNVVSLPSTIEVLEINVQQGQVVTAGTVLATLDELSVKSTYYRLLEELDEYQEELDDYSDDESDYYRVEQEIAAVTEAIDIVEPLLDSSQLIAQVDGEIATVNSGVTQTTESTTTESTTTETTSATSTGESGKMIGLSTTSEMDSNVSLMNYNLTSTQVVTTVSDTGTGTNTGADGGTDTGADTGTDTGTDGGTDTGTDGGTDTGADSGTDTGTDGGTDTDTDTDTDAEETPGEVIPLAGPLALPLESPKTGATPTVQLPNSTYFTSTLTWNVTTPTFLPNTVYQVKVDLVAAEGYVFTNDITPSINDALISDFVIGTNGQSQSTLSFIATFPATEEADSQGGGNGQGEVTSPTTEGSAGRGQVSSQGMQSSLSQQGSGTEQVGESVAVVETVSYTEILAFHSSSQMVATIVLDEMDILSIELGQTVYINIDAIGSDTLEAQVIDIDYMGINSNGSTKYNVEVSFERLASMKDGMSLSASIVTNKHVEALSVPASAIVNEGTESYVYTSYDSDSQILSGKVLVETGKSDGVNVEIIEGIEEGATIYYEEH